MTQVLEELELQVEVCGEIFHAVEKLTSGRFEAVVADFEAGLEASFLLKTAGELKSSGGPCRVAIAKDEESSSTARRIGAIVLQKPIVLEQAKYALLSSDEFLRRMSNWMPQTAAPEYLPPRVESSRDSATGVMDGVEPALCRVDAPELFEARTGLRQLPPAEYDLLENSRIQALFRAPRRKRSPGGRSSSWRKVAWVAVFAAVFLISGGYIFSQPLRTEVVKTSVARICRQAVQSTKTWLHRPSGKAEPEVQEAEGIDPEPLAVRSLPVIYVSPSHRPTTPSVSRPDEPQPEPSSLDLPRQSQVPQPSSKLQIPDSLHTPIQMTAVAGVEPKVSSALLGPVEPVEIPEQVARELLVQKVAPRYPEQARKTGLQGPVIFQARIGRDGKIENLKLVDGYLVLGRAAYQAVQQWRFKPYVVDGHPIAAQTYITLNFQLPAYSSLLPQDEPPKEGKH